MCFVNQCCGEPFNNGPQMDSMATRMSSAGYDTMYAGKYLNRYEGAFVPGWSHNYMLHGNSRYYNVSVMEQLGWLGLS